LHRQIPPIHIEIEILPALYGRWMNADCWSPNSASLLWTHLAYFTDSFLFEFNFLENISFWAGPANLTGNSVDFFPTQNGFYLSSLPLDSQTFNLKPIQVKKCKNGQFFNSFIENGSTDS
jgi:hypothetical protein